MYVVGVIDWLLDICFYGSYIVKYIIVEKHTCWGGNDFILHRLTTPGTESSQVLVKMKSHRLTVRIFHTRTSDPEFTQAVSHLNNTFCTCKTAMQLSHKFISLLKPTGTHSSQVRSWKSPKFMKWWKGLESRIPEIFGNLGLRII